MKKLVLLLSSCLFLFSACQNKEEHFLTKRSYREKVQQQFEKRRLEAAHRSEALFSVFDREDLTLKQKEALQFLYAYMPLCDLSEYDGEFFLKQINSAFEAQDYFSWGKSVPESIFRHFVMVYRINNEYLDDARQVFFEELKDRVKGMTMEEAALEVNHWCHEKVTYRATDPRTSAPLALVKTSWGRCGEESTFTAAALRAVGIPARQCYTPRWVHTNSNHAWVEVWIDGQWRYLGACEPEPELDVAWFTAPAKRAMMVHTNVFGLYDGPEEKNFETALYSKINLLSNYAPTREVKVKVVDADGKSVEGADVKYKVYNYSELFPIAEGITNKSGEASLTTGMGGLLIWATKDGQYGYAKADPDNNNITVVLDQYPGQAFEEDFVMEAPGEQQIKEISADKIAANMIRLAQEDSIRNAYMSTFATEQTAADLAKKTGLNKSQIWKYLHLAQGNWEEIAGFIESEKANPDLFPFLASLLEKDLRDTPAAILRDHLQTGKTLTVKPGVPKDLIVSKILSPRISQELIKPWRSFFQQTVIADEIAGTERQPKAIIDYIKKTIEIKNDENYYSCYLTPQGVYELKMADARSRDVFFVAVCRSLGIPAHVDEATRKPQYYEDGQWKDAIFEDAEDIAEIQPQATIRFTNAVNNMVKPGYSTHFTLGFYKDGDFQTLNLRNNPKMNDFPAEVSIDEGYYRLMVGSRANDGSVFVHTAYFEVKEGDIKELKIELPEIKGKLFVKGLVDMNTIVVLNDQSKVTLKDLDKGKGLMICLVDVGKEPSKHILQDLPKQQTELENWGGGILLMSPDDKVNKAFDASAFPNLPKQTLWGIDNNRALLASITEALKIEFGDNFPLTVYVSTNGGILYSSTGYRIGIGEDIIKTIRQEKETAN